MSSETTSLVLHPLLVGPKGEWINSMADWCCLYLDSGDATFVLKDASRGVSAGDVLVVRPLTGGRLVAREVGQFEGWYFRFSPEQFSGLLGDRERRLLQSDPADGERIRLHSGGTQIAKHFAHVVDEARRQSSLTTRFQLIELTTVILGAEFAFLDSHPNEARPCDTHLRELLARINSDDLIHLSVEELARKIGYSRRHLSRLFQEQFGRTIISYKMQMRLEKAARMLKDPDAKVTHVALECGFSHLGLFSVKFRELFGISPSKWRSRISGDSRAASAEPVRSNLATHSGSRP